MFDYNTLKKLLFLFDPEKAHNLTEEALITLPKLSPIYNKMVKDNFVDEEILHQNIFGVTFKNPVGLAAGFDKNATMIKAMPALGLGFSEIGTMTPVAQDGNPKPRMFRYPEYKSVQNAMGFNNLGSEVVKANLSKVYPYSIPIGANIGKNKITSSENALNDYKILIEKFKDISDYLVINISSPNTPNLRDLQNEAFIKELFELGVSLTSKPILLKIAPDMTPDVAISICKCAVENGASGIIATNTTIDYSLIPNCENFGGLSGAVLTNKSYNLFKEIAKELFGKTILISAGGINNAEEAYKRIKAGATLVQAYTGLIYEGPSMAKKINKALISHLKADGFTHISQAIGCDLK